MTLDLNKIKDAAMADTEDELQWSSTGILELITRLEAAEKDAARLDWLIKQFNLLLRLDAWNRESIDAAMKESEK